VVSRTGFSAQTLSVMAVLCASPQDWQHGYAIASDTGLKSGTLYPILIRLADRGLIEARWEEEQPAGRPRRHLYRLTPEGAARAAAALAARPRTSRVQARAVRPAVRLPGEVRP
jgi:DNA-binding PadR family transcriptional regulator